MKKYKKKKFQHSKHVRLWNAIVHILQNDDLKTITDVGELKEKAFAKEFSEKKKKPSCCCFACEFVEGLTGHLDCEYCPLKWPRCDLRRRRTCVSPGFNNDGLYDQFCMFFYNYKDGQVSLDNAIELAEQIRDVPVKKWVKCK